MIKLNKKVSIIIPCFNEKKTLKSLILKIHKQKNIKKEIILVDDFSTDGTRELIKNFKNKLLSKILLHSKNKGKGACIKTAKKYIKGDIVIIQDADLEYNPKDYSKLIKPILEKKYQVVYGSRVLGKYRYTLNTFSSIYRIFFNHMLTIFSNLINNQKLTDAHTCYKVFSKDVFKKIHLKENRFSFCPEVTTKLGNRNIPIKEVSIDYNGRSYKEGKKISIKDGFSAIFCIIKYRYFD